MALNRGSISLGRALQLSSEQAWAGKRKGALDSQLQLGFKPKEVRMDIWLVKMRV